jgi:F-type H+-transporting ATPase subunit epsilon
MRLKIMLPSHIFFEEEVAKVIAEAENGQFCLLPRHADLAAALVPGILAYWDLEDTEHWVAVDEGILIKCGPEVRVATRQAVLGRNREDLRQPVDDVFRRLDEQERKTRSALARMEAEFARRLWELGKHGAP